jgi:hypothetical protein
VRPVDPPPPLLAVKLTSPAPDDIRALLHVLTLPSGRFRGAVASAGIVADVATPCGAAQCLGAAEGGGLVSNPPTIQLVDAPRGVVVFKTDWAAAALRAEGLGGGGWAYPLGAAIRRGGGGGIFVVPGTGTPSCDGSAVETDWERTDALSWLTFVDGDARVRSGQLNVKPTAVVVLRDESDAAPMRAVVEALDEEATKEGGRGFEVVFVVADESEGGGGYRPNTLLHKFFNKQWVLDSRKLGVHSIGGGGVMGPRAEGGGVGPRVWGSMAQVLKVHKPFVAIQAQRLGDFEEGVAAACRRGGVPVIGIDVGGGVVVGGVSDVVATEETFLEYFKAFLEFA